MANLDRRRLGGLLAADLYELLLNRHWLSSFVISSNRTMEEWLSLFNDPIFYNSALDWPKDRGVSHCTVTLGTVP